MTLNLVIDNSGSLSEGGRRFVARTAVRQILYDIQHRYTDVDVNVYFLSQTMERAFWSFGEDVPDRILNPSRSMNVDAFLAEPEVVNGRTILITDFCFDRKTSKKIRDWMESRTTAFARAVALGEVGMQKSWAGVFEVVQLDGLLEGFIVQD